MKKIIRQILDFFRIVFWIRPTEKPEPFTAKEVAHIYTCIQYKGQWINLKKTEIAAFDAMARTDKRGMAQKFANQVKKGHIKFVEINGVMTCIKNKSYESKADGR